MQATKYNLVLERVQDYEFSDDNLKNPLAVKNLVNKIFNLENQAEEVFVIVGISSKGDVVQAFEVHRGTLNSSLVHSREIFKRLLLSNAASFFMAHNHPSGNPSPSASDLETTRRIQKAGELLDVLLLDHIIIGYPNYISLRENGDIHFG